MRANHCKRGIFTRYAAVLAVCLVFLLSAASIEAAENCGSKQQGDTVCGGEFTPEADLDLKNPAPEPTTVRVPVPSPSPSPILGGGAPILDTSASEKPPVDYAGQLKKILAAYPSSVRDVISLQTVSFLTKGPSVEEREEHFKKLLTLLRKLDDLSKKTCGLTPPSSDSSGAGSQSDIPDKDKNKTPAKTAEEIEEELKKILAKAEKDHGPGELQCLAPVSFEDEHIPDLSAVKDDYSKFIFNAFANALQQKDMTEMSLAQFEAYLSTLENDVCKKLSDKVKDDAYVSPDGTVDKDYGKNDGDVPTNYSSPNSPTPPPGGYPQASGIGGARIADCAKKMVGTSTANSTTQGGRLGCALGVSMILDCAGYSQGTHYSTNTLFDALSRDPCYQRLPMSTSMQPGDVPVTTRASRAGHTGVAIENGRIISNSSSSGTIQVNYNAVSWQSVVRRNPSGSAIFRRTCQ